MHALLRPANERVEYRVGVADRELLRMPYPIRFHARLPVELYSTSRVTAKPSGSSPSEPTIDYLQFFKVGTHLAFVIGEQGDPPFLPPS